MMLFGGSFDIVIAGAGHAGCEAALACARMGMRTLLLTLNLDSVALMPCNPAIGGTGKGHLVRELDAMGGEMGLAADDTLLQMRMLNRGKGPAVHSLRAQIDKRRYHERMKCTLEAQENLTLRTGEVTGVQTKNGRVCGVETAEGFACTCRALVIASGVYLKSRILIGECAREAGPSGLLRAEALSGALSGLGIPIRRFKTGTPPRVAGSSLDYSKMERQDGETPITPFSFLTERMERDQTPCYLCYTNGDTHALILENLNRSPMYSGKIHATGTRYCPSIEDKLVRFPDKDRHQIFIEPEGLSTDERYVQGMSTSLPADVQRDMLRTVKGMERAEITRFGYAIEYDCLDPTVLTGALMVKSVPGLFTAGQLNGSSGYEEAAAQGYLAGVNAALYAKEEDPFLLARGESCIGVLVDDLSVKGTPEPYRMMTSRCEYRLLLRQDNADLRLTEKARRTGLISDARYALLQRKREGVARMRTLLEGYLPPSEALSALLAQTDAAPGRTGVKRFDLLKRPGVRYTDLLLLDASLPAFPENVVEQLELSARYDGYIQKQEEALSRARALEGMPLPPDFEYALLTGLRVEAQQKLSAVHPATIGQAGRISGVTPADVAVLLIAAKRGFAFYQPKDKE